MQRPSWLKRRAAEQTDNSSGALVREGERVRLRRHVPENRAAFQRWYADDEIARLLRHDQRPLNEIQSRGYFDTLILPMSANGSCYAIHEIVDDRLIGTTAITDFEGTAHKSAFFRIVIGEKDRWGRGFGTEATQLVMREAFGHHELDLVKLEVFRHNPRAIGAYERVGFAETGQHIEFVGRERWELHVVEMELLRDGFEAIERGELTTAFDATPDVSQIMTEITEEASEEEAQPRLFGY